MRISLRFSPSDPDQAAVIRWLESEGNVSDAVRRVLVEHVRGRGVSLALLSDKLDRVLAKIGGDGVVVNGGDGDDEGDGLAYLDEMGL